MNIDFFRDLPPEIIEILSILPVRIIARCNTVCKSWRDLLQTREFIDRHFSKSASGLVFGNSYQLQISEFADELDLAHHHRNGHCILVTKIDCSKLMGFPQIVSSANGLLFLSSLQCGLYICNPVTHEYIKLPNDDLINSNHFVRFRFGVSKMTCQYKVVRIIHEHDIRDPGTLKLLTKCVCHVYTLGTGGTWKKSIASCPVFRTYRFSECVFLNGSLHWLVTDSRGSNLISCFDLETEIFSTFSPPALLLSDRHVCQIAALGDYLCFCNNSDDDDELVIWVMKEYGDEKSWTKEYVINEKTSEFLLDAEDFRIPYASLRPIKVFQDGDILMVWCDSDMFYYNKKTKTTAQIDFNMLGLHEDDRCSVTMLLHSSSFVSLKSFSLENVAPF